ncbi:MAG TPA: heavy metal-responsive transcriptional regulator [Streptomyces sp.]|nr:heavy metal-responsive transcriptional regulator [Streptomyces sp.]
MAMQGLTIGQAAQAAGITRKAVLVYEAKGLLPRAERSMSGYRLYIPDDVELLGFIRQARTLGLHLDDIREVLDIRRGGTPPCDAVRNLLDARITEVDTTVNDLLALRQTLVDTRRAAEDRPCGDVSTVCSIIEDA